MPTTAWRSCENTPRGPAVAGGDQGVGLFSSNPKWKMACLDVFGAPGYFMLFLHFGMLIIFQAISVPRL